MKKYEYEFSLKSPLLIRQTKLIQPIQTEDGLVLMSVKNGKLKYKNKTELRVEEIKELLRFRSVRYRMETLKHLSKEIPFIPYMNELLPIKIKRRTAERIEFEIRSFSSLFIIEETTIYIRYNNIEFNITSLFEEKMKQILFETVK
jgi:hypothetical protein